MHKLIKILVVEDEMIIGAKISMYLSTLGYEVTGVLPRGEEVLSHVKQDTPDIILLDVHLKGKMDGIETAASMEQYFQIPIIYITANADNDTFNRARKTRPAAFISKPFKKLDLQRAIELTISRMAVPQNVSITDTDIREEEPFILNDRIFIRYKERMVKIMKADILYIEADRNYSRIYTTDKEYVLSITLKAIEEKFASHLFQRIHRSYYINLQRVEAVADDHVIIAQRAIPVSESLKVHLMQHLQKL